MELPVSCSVTVGSLERSVQPVHFLALGNDISPFDFGEGSPDSWVHLPAKVITNVNL